MATADELRSAVRESLEAQGVLSEVRARLRAEVFRLVDAGAEEDIPQRLNMPTETVVVCELVREFLSFAGYTQTLSVFEAESAAESTLSRDVIAADLGVTQAPGSDGEALPLIFGLIEALKRNRRSRIEAL